MLIKCKACGKEKEHHAKKMCFNCYRNTLPPKMIVCKNCGRKMKHKAFGLCGTCHIKLYHYDLVKRYNCNKLHEIPLELYREKTKKCLICGFDKVVDLHHLDENHKNTNPSNLIGLCPNHHKMLHNEKYSQEVKDLIQKKLKATI